MDFHIIIDRGQAIWAAQQATLKVLKLQGKSGKVSAGGVNSLLRLSNSAAFAILGSDVIYFQRFVKEEYIPYILAHEELHLLLYELMLADSDNFKLAAKTSSYVDSPYLRLALSETFENLDYNEMMRYLAIDLLKTMPFISGIRKLVRRLRNAFSKKRGN